MFKNCIIWLVLLPNPTGALKHLEGLAAILFTSKLILKYEKLRTLKKYIQNMRIFVFKKWSASSTTLFLLLGGFVWNPPWLSALRMKPNKFPETIANVVCARFLPWRLKQRPGDSASFHDLFLTWDRENVIHLLRAAFPHQEVRNNHRLPPSAGDLEE